MGATPARRAITTLLAAVLVAATLATGASPAHAHGGSAPYVEAVYRLFLERPPTPAEAARWHERLDAGTPRSALTAELSTSTEWAGVVIADLYVEALDRPAEGEGLAYWVDQVRRGADIRRVAVQIFGSAEAYQRAGGTPATFVDALYQRILQRGPDPAGRAHWVAALADGRLRPVEVVAAFWDSLELRQDRVRATYLAVLGRRPDQGGLRFWTEELLRYDEVRLAAELAASDEFFAAATAGATPVDEPAQPAPDRDGDGHPDALEQAWGTDVDHPTGDDCWALAQRYGPWDADALVPLWPVEGGDHRGEDLRGCGDWIPASTTVRGVDFSGARLDGNHLGTSLEDVDLSGASATGCRLGGGPSSGGSATGVDLTGADLTGCSIDALLFDSTTVATDAVLRGTTWRSYGDLLAGIRGATATEGLDLRDAGGTAALFTGTDLGGALLGGGSFDDFLVCPSQALLEGPGAALGDCPDDHGWWFEDLAVELTPTAGGGVEVVYTWTESTDLWLRVLLDGEPVHSDVHAHLGDELRFTLPAVTPGEHVLTLTGDNDLVAVALDEHRFRWPPSP